MRAAAVLFIVLLLCHCAGKMPTVDEKHPFYNKKIGLFFDLSEKYNYRGVDFHDLKDYLTYLEKYFNENTQNVRFKLILSGLHPDARYHWFHDKVKTEFTGKSILFNVAVPEKTAFERINHKLDYLFLIDAIDFEGRIQVTQFREFADPATERRIKAATARDKSLGRHAIDFQMTNDKLMSVTDENGSEMFLKKGMIIHGRQKDYPTVEGAVTLKYLLWDYAADSPVAFDFHCLQRKEKFGENDSSLEEEAALMAQEILRKILR